MFGLQPIRGGSMDSTWSRTLRNNIVLLRASMAIAKNLSMDGAQPSQLINPSNAFEESHRHYSFIAMLAMMSLFLLITISITGLLLGFCRKKNYPKTEGKTDGNSQFELNDIDMEVETKMRKGDPHGVCYYHLSDDDDGDMDDDDDDANDDDLENITDVKEKRRRKEARRHERKWRRMRDRGYYYHLYTNDDDDDDSWDEKGYKENHYNETSGDHYLSSGKPEGLQPKRSTTFPQLHNVLTSCIRGKASQTEHVQYHKLQPTSSANTCVSSDYISNESDKEVQLSSTNVSKCTCSSTSSRTSSPSKTHQRQHLAQSSAVQIIKPVLGSNTDSSPKIRSIRNRHAHHKQRQARKQRLPLHMHQQNKLRPSHLQHYSSLSYHRHTRMHQAVRHNAWPAHKRMPAALSSGGGFLYKSHSIHAIPCSETKEQQSLDTPKSSQCQVQITVERVDCDSEDEKSCHLLANVDSENV